MNKKIRWLKQMAVVGLFPAALAISGVGNAAELVQNGDFTDLGTSPNNAFSVANPMHWNQPTGGVNFIFGPRGADAIGAGPAPNTEYLWGPHNPVTVGPKCAFGIVCNSNNRLPATSPNGGNYLAADGDPDFQGPITQTIPTLNVGQSYVLNFDYATAQLRNNDGTMWGNGNDIQSAWQVKLGGSFLTGPGSSTLNSRPTTTPVLTIHNHGFSGWQHDAVTFTATPAEALTGLLSFLAEGTPGGTLPPIALLDSVSIMAECVPGSAASYIGTTCVKGDKKFSNFKYTPTAIGSAIASSAAQTTITPIMSGNNEGFDINGIWDAGPGGAADAVLSYTVQSLAGNTIDDAGLTITGSAIGGGVATVGETICEGDLLSDGCASGTSATLQASLPGDPTDHITFAPTDLVDISKDIDVFGGTGFASLSDVINTVSQCSPCGLPDPPTVPEPPSLALLGVGLAGLAGVGLVRRRRC